MKSQKYQERFYRNWVDAKQLHKIQVIEKESDILILSDYPFKKEIVESLVRKYRSEIENYIKKNKIFLTTLKPINLDNNAPSIVKDMAKATKLANVGPMASVAGAIADYLAKDLQKKAKELIIENGGDIFIKTKKKRRIRIYAGQSSFTGKIAIEIEPHQTPLGICTSSGTVGHSLSFGNTDASVVIAKSAIIADSFATAIGNMVKTKSDVKKAIEFAKTNKKIEGILIIIQDLLSACGSFKIVSG